VAASGLTEEPWGLQRKKAKGAAAARGDKARQVSWLKAVGRRDEVAEGFQGVIGQAVDGTALAAP